MFFAWRNLFIRIADQPKSLAIRVMGMASGAGENGIEVIRLGLQDADLLLLAA